MGFLSSFFLDLRYQKTGQRLLASKEEKQFSCGKEGRRTIVYYGTKRILSVRMRRARSDLSTTRVRYIVAIMAMEKWTNRV